MNDRIVGMILMFVDAVKTIFNKNELVNFTMMMEINIIMFGVTLGCIGVIGQYIGRIFDESKVRPIYIIDSTKNYNRDDKKYNIINLEQKTL